MYMEKIKNSEYSFVILDLLKTIDELKKTIREKDKIIREKDKIIIKLSNNILLLDNKPDKKRRKIKKIKFI